MKDAKWIITLCAFLCISVPAEAGKVVGVTKVINGHTLELSDGRTVRLIGVKADSEESTAYVKELVEGKGVVLEYDVKKEDDEGRELVYAVMIETFLNATILMAGYGTPVSEEPNTKYDTFFQNMHQYAVAHKRGLWNK